MPNFGLDPPTHQPPPNPLFWCPHPDKEGTNLLLRQIGIHLHTHQDMKLNCCSDMGQKLRYGRPCIRDLAGTHNWLAQSHIASISSELHWLSHLMLAQSCMFWVICCFVGLTHPTACTRARAPLTLGHVHRPPLNPIRVPIDWAPPELKAQDSAYIFKVL